MSFGFNPDPDYFRFVLCFLQGNKFSDRALFFCPRAGAYEYDFSRHSRYWPQKFDFGDFGRSFAIFAGALYAQTRAIFDCQRFRSLFSRFFHEKHEYADEICFSVHCRFHCLQYFRRDRFILDHQQSFYGRSADLYEEERI